LEREREIDPEVKYQSGFFCKALRTISQ